jgi:type 1 glutamine amidotransferase
MIRTALVAVSLVGAGALVALAQAPPAQNQTPVAADVQQMIAALPSSAPATPARPRKVLVFAHADEYVHSSIPLAARTAEELGKKTGAWATTVSYDPSVITAANLGQYDAIFLASTTGHFLDDPASPATTDARRSALLAFVRGGKGLAGIHAASDSYHTPAKRPWTEFNPLIGGIFLAHPWQHVSVKVEDPSSPITAAYRGQTFEMTDETYTFAKEAYSRENVHVLLSVDLSRMPPEDLAKENRPWDHDYALSWIRREGTGRVFYTAHGHREQVYAMTPFLTHLLAGIQYAIGDLKANDSPGR